MNTVIFYVCAERHKVAYKLELSMWDLEEDRYIFNLRTNLGNFQTCQKALKCFRDGTDCLTHSHGCFAEEAADHSEQ